jgi:hypothetical protein
MNIDPISVPYIKVNPTSTIRYNLLEDGDGNIYRRYKEMDETLKNLLKNSHKGNLSGKAKKRLADSVDWINELTISKIMKVDNMTIRYRLNFITLTLPSKQWNDKVNEMAEKLQKKDIDNGVQNNKTIMDYIDSIIKSKCLNQFLTEMRQEFGMKLYIWRAESQKNGNIHFHVITDIGVHYLTVRKMWNRIINKLGYVNEFRKEHESLSLKEYMEKYPKRRKVKGKEESEFDFMVRMREIHNINCKHNWSNPNSTDIHSIRNIKDMRKYITKYLCKEPDGKSERLLKGRIWFISRALSKARNMTDMVTGAISDELNKVIESPKAKTFVTEHCMILQMTIKEIENLGGIIIPEIFENKLKYLKEEVYGGK